MGFTGIRAPRGRELSMGLILVNQASPAPGALHSLKIAHVSVLGGGGISSDNRRISNRYRRETEPQVLENHNACLPAERYAITFLRNLPAYVVLLRAVRLSCATIP
jgi:hypothetical protein